MKTLTKAAISAAAVMTITSGTLALTASAAVEAFQYDLPLIIYSANTNEQVITDETASLLTYSINNYTKKGQRIYNINSADQQITTNTINKGRESSINTTSYPYYTNYKWCSVFLEDNEHNYTSINSLRDADSTPTSKSVKAYLNDDLFGELNGTINKGYYIFRINDNSSSSAATLSDVRLTVNRVDPN